MQLCCGYSLWLLEWYFSCLYAYSTHGRNSNINDFGEGNCAVNYQWSSGSDYISAFRVYRAGMDHPAILTLYCGFRVCNFLDLTRKTAIGMFIESVGTNFRSSFYSGIDEKKIKVSSLYVLRIMRRNRRVSSQFKY